MSSSPHRPFVHRPTSIRSLAAIVLVGLGAGVLLAPSAATAAPDTAFTFTQPAAATSGVVQYSAAGPVVTTLNGTGPDGATVRIETVDAGTLAFGYPCETTVTSGTWSCDVTFGNFLGTVTAQRMEESGGVSLPVESIPYTVVALVPPTFDPASTAVVSSSTLATLTGTVTPLGGSTTASVRVTVEGDEICVSVVAPNGTWSCSASFGGSVDTVLDLAATQTRTVIGAGSGTSLPTTTTYTLDTTGPTSSATFTTPAGSTLTVTPGSFGLAGTAEPLGFVSVTAGGVALCGPVAVSAAGTWSCAATVTALGTSLMTILHSDSLGNSATAASESISLTVQTAAIVVPPNLNVAPPPQFVTLPNLTILPPPVPVQIVTDLPAQLIDVSTALVADSPARQQMENIIVTSVQGVFEATGGPGSTRYSVPINQVPDVSMLISLRSMFPDGLPDVTVVDPTTGQIGPRQPTWSDLPWRAQVFFLYTDRRTREKEGDPFPTDPDLGRSITPFQRDGDVNSLVAMNKGEVLLDQQELSGDGQVNLSANFPEGVEPGDYDLIVRVVLDPNDDVGVPVPENVEPVEVVVPITLIADDAAADSSNGVAWWLWAALAALAIGIVAVVVVMARGAQRHRSA